MLALQRRVNRAVPLTVFVLAACATGGLPLGPDEKLDNPAHDASDAVAEGDDAAASCDAREGWPAAPLVRLGVDDYERTLRSLFGDRVVDEATRDRVPLPADKLARKEAFQRVDHRISERHVEGFYRTADAVAQAVSRDAAARAALAGPCASTGVDEACLAAFVPELLLRTLRRPPGADEIATMLELGRTFEGFDRLHAVLFATLMSPDFLFHFEHRGRVREGGRLELTPHELASRLSYHFWGAPPDAELLASARSGALDDEEGFRKQVERVYADPRSEAMLVQFFDEWLELERGELRQNERLTALAGDLDLIGLAGDMRRETHDLLRHVLRTGGTWRDALTTTLSFARSAPLASIYGVPVWDGVGRPPELPRGERSGVLTRAAVLLSSDGSTNPFRRGVLVRRSLLCEPVPPPPPTILPSDLARPDPEVGSSTRAAFAAKVQDEPCKSCHQMFAPLGYALESYDGIGRFRREERLLSDDGEELGRSPIDARVEPRVDARDPRPTDGPVELSQRIAESEKASACLARQYFRFTHRRFEQRADECAIARLSEQLADGASLSEAMRALALDPSFRVRALED